MVSPVVVVSPLEFTHCLLYCGLQQRDGRQATSTELHVYTLTAGASVTCPDRKGHARQGIMTILGIGVHHEYVDEHGEVLGMSL